MRVHVPFQRVCPFDRFFFYDEAMRMSIKFFLALLLCFSGVHVNLVAGTGPSKASARVGISDEQCDAFAQEVFSPRFALGVDVPALPPAGSATASISDSDKVERFSVASTDVSEDVVSVTPGLKPRHMKKKAQHLAPIITDFVVDDFSTGSLSSFVSCESAPRRRRVSLPRIDGFDVASACALPGFWAGESSCSDDGTGSSRPLTPAELDEQLANLSIDYARYSLEFSEYVDRWLDGRQMVLSLYKQLLLLRSVFTSCRSVLMLTCSIDLPGEQLSALIPMQLLPFEELYHVACSQYDVVLEMATMLNMGPILPRAVCVGLSSHYPVKKIPLRRLGTIVCPDCRNNFGSDCLTRRSCEAAFIRPEKELYSVMCYLLRGVLSTCSSNEVAIKGAIAEMRALMARVR